MRRLLAAFIALGAATGVTVLLGILRAKWLAVQLGPEGIGVLSQVFNAAQLASGVATLGIGWGVVREVSSLRAQGDFFAIGRTLRLALALSVPGAILLTIGGLLWAPQLADLLLADSRYAPLLRIASLSVAPVALASLFLSGLNGLGEYRWLARLNVATALAALLLLVPLVLRAGLKGAVWQIALIGFLQLFAVMAVLAMRLPSGSMVASPGVNSAARASLLSYGLLYTVIGFAQQGSLLFVRSRLLEGVGEVPAGFFTAAWAISWSYLSLVVGSLQPYYLAELAHAGDGVGSSQVASDVLRLVALVQAPVSVTAILFAEPLMRILYSERFLPAAALLRVQATSDLLTLWSWVLFLPFVAARRLGWALAMECSFWLTLAWLVTRTSTLMDVAWAVLASRVVQIGLSLGIFWRRGGARFQMRSVVSVIAAMVFVGSAFVCRALGIPGALILVAAAVGWAVATVRRQEVRAAVRWATGVLKDRGVS